MKPPEKGELLAERFTVVGQLGEGGSSVVYRAHDARSDREVAVKLLASRYLGRPEREQRLLDEGAYLRRIGSHPNLVALVDAGRLTKRGGWPYVATELLEGTSLDWTLVYTKPPLTILRELAVQLAGALAACHAAGVVHRDLTPSNVFVIEDASGRSAIKLFDFSHAGVVDGPRVAAGVAGRLTGAWDVPGTHGYMGPEQVRTEPADPKMDVFAFGIVLYEMITGHSPYEHIREREKFIDMQRRGVLEAPRLHAWAYEVPEALADLVTACTEREPESRPSMSEVVARLSGLELHAEAKPASDATEDVTLALDPQALAKERRREHERALGSWTLDRPSEAIDEAANEAVTEERTAIVPLVVRPPAASASEPELAFSRPCSVDELPVLPLVVPVSTQEHEEVAPPASRRAPIVAISTLVVALVLALGVTFGLHFAGAGNASDTPHADENLPSKVSEPPDDGSPEPRDPTQSPLPAAIQGPERMAPSPVKDETPPASEPEPLAIGPRSATQACADTREAAQQAKRGAKWAALERVTRDRACWKSSVEPLRMQVHALFELQRFDECVRVGSKSKDSEVKKWVSLCEGSRQ